MVILHRDTELGGVSARPQARLLRGVSLAVPSGLDASVRFCTAFLGLQLIASLEGDPAQPRAVLASGERICVLHSIRRGARLVSAPGPLAQVCLRPASSSSSWLCHSFPRLEGRSRRVPQQQGWATLPWPSWTLPHQWLRCEQRASGTSCWTTALPSSQFAARVTPSL